MRKVGAWLLTTYCIVSFLFAAYVYISIIPSFNEASFFVPVPNSGVEHDRKTMKDFVWIYSGAVMASECGPEKNLYDFNHQTAIINRVIAPYEIDSPMILEYPPWFLLMLRPLSILSLRAAYIFWCFFSFLMLLVSLNLLGRLARFGLKEQLAAASLAVFLPATYYELQNAQSTAVSLLCLTIFWVAFCQRKYFWTGFIGALATVKPQFALLPILLGASTLKRSYFYGLFVGLMLCIMPVCILYGPHSLVSWAVALHEGESNPNFYNNAVLDLSAMWNLRGLLICLPSSDSPIIRLTCVGAFLSASLALIWVWWKCGRRLEKPDLCLFASLSVLISLVIAPHSWAYDYILLVIPGCLLWYWSGIELSLPTFSKYFIRSFILFFPAFSWTFFALKLTKLKLEFWLVVVLILFVTLQKGLLQYKNNELKIAQSE